MVSIPIKSVDCVCVRINIDNLIYYLPQKRYVELGIERDDDVQNKCIHSSIPLQVLDTSHEIYWT